MDNNKVEEVIFKAVDELNLLLPEDKRLTKSAHTPLIGDKSELDSIGRVTFVVAAEEKVEEAFGVGISLADERVMSGEESPFKTIGTLTEYISLLLREKISGTYSEKQV